MKGLHESSKKDGAFGANTSGRIEGPWFPLVTTHFLWPDGIKNIERTSTQWVAESFHELLEQTGIALREQFQDQAERALRSRSIESFGHHYVCTRAIGQNLQPLVEASFAQPLLEYEGRLLAKRGAFVLQGKDVAVPHKFGGLDK